MSMDFGGGTGLGFKNPETGEAFVVAVKDKYPQMQDVHVEGRRTVEISVELFVQMMTEKGFGIVDPKTGDVVMAEGVEEND